MPVELSIQDNPTKSVIRIILVLLKGKVRIYQPRKSGKLKNAGYTATRGQ